MCKSVVILSQVHMQQFLEFEFSIILYDFFFKFVHFVMILLLFNILECIVRLESKKSENKNNKTRIEIMAKWQ